MLGLLPRRPGLPLLVALPPLDLFTDLRILLAHAPDYAWLLLGVAGAVPGRSPILAFLLGRPMREASSSPCASTCSRYRWRALAGVSSWIAHAGLYSGLHGIGQGLALVTLLILGPVAWAGAGSVRSGLWTTFRAARSSTSRSRPPTSILP